MGGLALNQMVEHSRLLDCLRREIESMRGSGTKSRVGGIEFWHQVKWYYMKRKSV